MTARMVVVCLAAVLVTSGCGEEVPTDGELGAIPDGQNCGEVVRPRLQEGSHLIGDAEPPVPYSSNPPTSGWHRSGAPSLGVRNEALTGPELVSALEFGHVVVAYDPDTLSTDEVGRLQQSTQNTFADQVTLTPWAPMPTPVALVGWNALQRCAGVDEGALTTFVLTWFGEALRHD